MAAGKQTCPPALEVDAARPHDTQTLSPGATLMEWRVRTPGLQGTFPVAAIAVRSRASVISPVVVRVPYPLDPRSVFRSRSVSAAINGDYFDYLGRDFVVPRGLVVTQGELLYAPVGWSRVVVFNGRGQARATWARPHGYVRIGSHAWRVHAINDPRARGGNVMFTDAWSADSASRRDGRVFVTLDRGVVVGKSRQRFLSVPPGGYVLRLSQASARNVRIGDSARITMHAVARDKQPIIHASGHGGSVLRDGQVRRLCSDYENLRRPRTMIAWDRAGVSWLLVSGTGSASGVSDVRPGGSTKRQLALVARSLGATEGVILDGGGSTAMFARVKGQVARIDAHPDAWVRPVPVAWMVARRG